MGLVTADHITFESHGSYCRPVVAGWSGNGSGQGISSGCGYGEGYGIGGGWSVFYNGRLKTWESNGCHDWDALHDGSGLADGRG